MLGVRTLKISLLTVHVVLSLHLGRAQDTSTPVPENYANVTAVCGTDAMTVLVEVAGDFDGKMYADGFASDVDTCHFFFDYDSTVYSLYSLEFDYTSQRCGQAWEEKENGTQEFSAVTYIQFDSSLIQGTDRRHTSTCVFDSQQQVSSRTGRVKEAGVDESNDTVSGTPLTMTIVDSDNNILGSDDVVDVGDVLELRITMITNPVLTDISVSDCQAFSKDPEKFPRAQNLTLITTDGCPTFTSVLAGGPSYESDQDAAEIFFRVFIYAFVFSSAYHGNDPTHLYFTCNVLLCSPSVTCDRPVCWGRRRRSADRTEAFLPDTDRTEAFLPDTDRTEAFLPDTDRTEAFLLDTDRAGQLTRRRRAEGAERGTVTGSVQVRAPGHSNGQSPGARQGEEGASYAQCVNSPTGQSLLAVLVILVLALVVTIVALTALNCRLRRRLTQLEKGVEGRGMDAGKLHG